MQPKKRTRYDDEFKRQTIALADSSGRPVGEIEKDLGLYQGAIRHWRAELEKHATDAFPGTGHLHPADEELRKLRRENEILRMERDILKKAVAIFSVPPRIDTRS